MVKTPSSSTADREHGAYRPRTYNCELWHVDAETAAQPDFALVDANVWRIWHRQPVDIFNIKHPG
jgi:hypothetical protein